MDQPIYVGHLSGTDTIIPVGCGGRGWFPESIAPDRDPNFYMSNVSAKVGTR